MRCREVVAVCITSDEQRSVAEMNLPTCSQDAAIHPRLPALTRIVSWSHLLVGEVLCPGDLAVDLTAGRGRDTLALARLVGPSGQVIAFDLQAAAIEQTATLLQRHGFTVHHWSWKQSLPRRAGIFLVQGCHSSIGRILLEAPRVVMANLGFLPGGDPALVTRPATTLDALQQSLDLLVPGSRLAVTVYPAHPGGQEEGTLVNGLLGCLPSDRWQVLSLHAANIGQAPYLLVAERRE